MKITQREHEDIALLRHAFCNFSSKRLGLFLTPSGLKVYNLKTFEILEYIDVTNHTDMGDPGTYDKNGKEFLSL